MNRILSTSLLLSGLAIACLCGQVAAGEAAPKPKPATSAKAPDCVYVPTPYDVVEKMLEMAKVKKDDIVWDLGCGDGRIVVQAAKKCGCKAVGYEIEPNRIREAHENIKKNNVEHLVEIRAEDMFTADLSEPTVLGLYILPSMMVKLRPQLEKLKPGSRIVAHDYPIATAEAEKVVRTISNETNERHLLYLYTIPLKEKKTE